LKYKTKIDLTDVKTINLKYTKEDVDTLYWFGGSIMSPASIDLTDPAYSAIRETGIELMNIAYMLDPDYGNGALHEYFLMYTASTPEGMGGGLEKAEYHYKRAKEITGGSRISPDINYAFFVSTSKEPQADAIKEYKKLLNGAISFDINKYPENRLENSVMKEKAVWLLKNIDNYFLVEE
jgi:hypothetical protein